MSFEKCMIGTVCVCVCISVIAVKMYCHRPVECCALFYIIESAR